MRQITSIAIHCSATRPSQDIGVAEITQWHKARGFATVGYQWVIRRDGRLEKGRDESVPGAHVEGHNSKSIGICLVGGIDDRGNPDNNFTPEQWGSLATLCKQLAARYPGAVFMGHRDYPGVAKACPSFDAVLWARQNGLRTAGAPAATTRPVLRLGATGDAVRDLQAALWKAGYAIAIDSMFGEKTDLSLRAFQRSRGLLDDGVAGPKTYAALRMT